MSSMKRELGHLSHNDLTDDGPRSKRRRGSEMSPSVGPKGEDGDTPGEAWHEGSTPPPGAAAADASASTLPASKQEREPDRQKLKGEALRLWQVLKDAITKDGRVASAEFLQLPSKKLYPTYYELIKRPVGLDDVKTRIDADDYPNLAAVREDLNQCFVNAKRFNQRDSQIWLDAKFLHKQLKKTYQRMTGIIDENEEEDTKREKVPNLYRQLKSRLNKIIDKTDDDGRVMSAIFMELPSKKDYPDYYTVIKRPQSLEMISKKLKRKEYIDTAEFASDMEAVFKNAATYNTEGSPIYKDATTLREYFRMLMADLPEPLALPEYSRLVPKKLKLKVGAGTDHAPPKPPQAAPANSTMIRRPEPPKDSKPLPPTSTLQSVSAAQKSQQLQFSHKPFERREHGSATPQPQSANQLPVAYNTIPTHQLPGTQFQPVSVPLQHLPLRQTAHPAPPPQIAPSMFRSPSPPPVFARQLDRISVSSKIRDKAITLDHRDGVKTWVMRLLPGEETVTIDKIRMIRQGSESVNESDQSDGGDNVDDSDNGHPRKRGPGRSKSGKGDKAAKRLARDAALAPVNFAVSLNGIKTNMADPNNSNGQLWELELPKGMNVVELGEEGGMIWKLFIERMT